MGSIIKLQSKRKGTRWRAQIQMRAGDGARHTESATFDTRALAKEWIARREAFIAREGVPVASAKSALLSAVISDYLSSTAGRFARSTVKCLEMIARTPLGATPVGAIDSKALVNYVAWRCDNPLSGQAPGPSTLNSDLVHLRNVLRYARDAQGHAVDLQGFERGVDLLRRTRQVAKSTVRTRRPSFAELKALDAYLYKRWQSGAAELPLWHLMWLAILLGRRAGELARIPRALLDRTSSTGVIVGGIKNPKGRTKAPETFAITPAGWDIIDLVLADLESEMLISFNVRTVSSTWPRACKLLGIADLHFHDLRHEAFSRLGEAGMTVPQISQVSLHRSWETLKRYVNMRHVNELFELKHSIRFNP